MREYVVACAFLSGIAVSCGGKNENKPGAGGPPAKGGPLPVEAMVVQPTRISESVEVTGTVLPFESTEIRPETSGRLVELAIREGATVRKGELLARLFDADLQAQLRKLQVQLQIAQKTEERQRELLRINGISQQDYDLSLLAVNNLNADIELTRVNIGRTEVRAPYAGRIGLRQVSPGAYVSPANVLATISQLDNLRLEFSIPEKYGYQVSPGLAVRFTVEGTTRTYTAQVSAKENRIEESTRNLVIRAVIRDADGYLVPGSFAKVRIILGQRDDAIMIPTEAVIPVARGKEVVVLRGGSVEFRGITTGMRDSARVQVVDGLTVGDTFVTTGLMFMRKDSKVKVTRLQ
jgi:membrane fusion protein (multidrug efflux system)